MPSIIPIDEPDDPRLAPYRDIRERDLAGRRGRFVAEGKVVLRLLLGSPRFDAESVLVLRNRLDGLDEILASAPDDLPVYTVPGAVMDSVAGFHVHRGILAIGRRPRHEDPGALLDALPDDAVILALVGISNHDNMGAIFRNAAGFGAAAVLIDETCCDPLYRKAIRVSVGAALTVPFASGGSGDEMVALMERRGFVPLALSPSGETDIADAGRPARAALLLGSEGEGLPATILARCRTLRIAMAPGFDSLNVATAAAIALHRLGPVPSIRRSG